MKDNNTGSSAFYVATIQRFAEGLDGSEASVAAMGETICELAHRFHKSPGEVRGEVARVYMESHGLPPVNLQQLDRAWLQLTGYAEPIRPPTRRR